MFQRNQTVSTIDRPQAALPEARPAGQTVVSDVLVPTLKSVVGGVGVGLIVERVLSIWGALPQDTVWFWSYSVGLFAFAVIAVFLALRDEIVIGIHAWAERRNAGDYTDLLTQLDDARLTISTMQAEIDRLAAVDGGSGNGAVILMAYRLLSDYYVNSLPFTQTEVLDRKVCSRQVWTLVTGFFKVAKITNGNGGVLVDNLPDAFGAFMKAHTACTHFEKVGGKLVKAPPPAAKKG
jgi:hypothetical protein